MRFQELNWLLSTKNIHTKIFKTEQPSSRRNLKEQPLKKWKSVIMHRTVNYTLTKYYNTNINIQWISKILIHEYTPGQITW